ncbi:MAG: EVE domain-containing protein [Planifilum fimeticola]
MDDHRERVDKPFHVWMMISSNKYSFRWDHILRTGGSVEWSGRRVLSNFKRAGEGDRILCYQTGVREKGLVGIAEVVHPMIEGIQDMEIKGIHRFPRTIPYEWFRHLPEYRETQAARLRHRGTLFSLTEPFVRRVRELLEEMGDLRGVRLLGGEAER